jgi:hypothetical protein
MKQPEARDLPATILAAMMTLRDFEIPTLGPPTFGSPLEPPTEYGAFRKNVDYNPVLLRSTSNSWNGGKAK